MSVTVMFPVMFHEWRDLGLPAALEGAPGPRLLFLYAAIDQAK